MMEAKNKTQLVDEIKRDEEDVKDRAASISAPSLKIECRHGSMPVSPYTKFAMLFLASQEATVQTMTHVLDLGCGSGALGITIAQMMRSPAQEQVKKVVFADVAEAALKDTAVNCSLNGVTPERYHLLKARVNVFQFGQESRIV